MRLIDCFAELITYTNYFLKGLKDSHPSFEDIKKNYQMLISRSMDAARSAGFTNEKWQEGFFPVCAWIDETILCSQWSEKEQWVSNQLQKDYFNTTNAGEEFYIRLENLEDEAKDVREVYEFCLVMGFKGKYYQASDIGRLEDIRYTNLKRITDNVDLVIPEALFPDAYEADNLLVKRKRWRGVSGFTILVILFPILLFIAMYYFFDYELNRLICSYFIQ